MLLKVDQNENAYLLYKCAQSKTVEKRIKMKTMTENIVGACVYKFNLRHLDNVQFYSFRTWTVENTSKQ